MQVLRLRALVDLHPIVPAFQAFHEKVRSCQAQNPVPAMLVF